MTIRPAVWLVATAVVLLDQLTKQWAIANLVEGVERPIAGEWLSLELVFNDGAAFSLGAGYTWVLTIIAIAVTGGIIYFARRAQTTFAAVLFGIGLGGAIGNLIDRLFRAPSFGQGHVVDMINYNGWFVGNVADIAIVGSAAVFVVMGIFGKSVLAPAPDSTDPTDSTDSTDSTDPTDRGDSTDPTDPTDPTDRGDSTDPTDPTATQDSTGPTEPPSGDAGDRA